MTVILTNDGKWEYPSPNRDYIEEMVGYLSQLYAAKRPVDLSWASRENEVLHLLTLKLQECGFPRRKQ